MAFAFYPKPGHQPPRLFRQYKHSKMQQVIVGARRLGTAFAFYPKPGHQPPRLFPQCKHSKMQQVIVGARRLGMAFAFYPKPGHQPPRLFPQCIAPTAGEAVRRQGQVGYGLCILS